MSALHSPKIVIDQVRKTIHVNGEELPWYLAEEGPKVDLGGSDVPTVVWLPVLVWPEDLEVVADVRRD